VRANLMGSRRKMQHNPQRGIEAPQQWRSPDRVAPQWQVSPLIAPRFLWHCILLA
jgi:hypothetical protein